MKFVFDFGGVLFRWQPAQMLRRVLPHCAADDALAAQWCSRIFGPEGRDWAAFDRGAIEPDELVRRLSQRLGLSTAQARAVVDGAADELVPLPESVALLQRLREAGHRTYFLSNMPRPMAQRLESTHAFVRAFDGGLFSGRERRAKPEAAFFALAAERFAAAPGELMFLDDHAPNVEAARALRWNALQFTDAASAQAELEQRGWR